MINKKTIGLMGASVCNDNMGCVALTYSLIKVLEKISKKNNFVFKYMIFENEIEEERYHNMANQLGIEYSQLIHAPVLSIYIHNLRSLLSCIKHTNLILNMSNMIKKCDVVIDLTHGDSFSDIYGKGRYRNLSNRKILVEKLNVPLILGPQTYGPFDNIRIKKNAAKIIENAQLVISRDLKSKEYLLNFCKKEVIATIDLAFGLPYKKARRIDNNKIKVGINPSGMLAANKLDKSAFKGELKTDYDEYMSKLVVALSNDDRYEVHIIPHVGDEAKKTVECPYNAFCHERFKDPIEAKNCISSMDVFVGTRMHATIAAFSSGVATIPVAYSRKFSGLYNSFGYYHVIDLQKLSTDHALEITMKNIENYKELQSDVNKCMNEVVKKYNELEDVFEKGLKRVFEKN